MRARIALVAAVVFGAVFAPTAGAVPLVLSDGSNLVNVDTATLNMPSAPIPVTGMQPGETLRSIDQRPRTGQLYGIGSTSRVYVLDLSTGAATQVGSEDAFSLNGTAFGTDFNPVVDRIRVVSNTEQNLRLNPDTGGLTATDAFLNPTGNVVAAAYTNNVAGSTGTTLFDIDSASGHLARQGGVNGTPDNPNGGVLHDVGGLGLGAPLDENIGFDIGADGVAAATITVSGVTSLYGINTTNGAASSLGQIGNGLTPYRGLAIMPARLRFSSDAVSGSEGGVAMFEVTRNAPAPGAVSVQYSTSPGTATEGDDYTPTTGTVAWGAGETGSKTIVVPVVDDSAGEGDETFTVTLSAVTGADAVLGAPKTAVATIRLNDAGVLQFDPSSVASAEGGSAVLTVTRAGSSSEFPISVDYATAPGTAGEADYTPSSGTLSWAAGDGDTKAITVPIADDADAEGAETFSVNLSNPTGSATLGSASSATVSIAASDQPVVTPPPKPLKPTLKLGGAKKQKLSTVRRKGVKISATVSLGCKIKATVRKGKRKVGAATRTLAKGKKTLRIKIRKPQRKRLRARQKLKVSTTCTAGTLKSATKKRTITLKRG